ncbi:hypothetical protein niasHT_012281 [Heterodera trifolii]|uniref:Uncharacterized protein n=1 Tax=Heterodera trifolii TaxID=157864 RepID=A0ABD2LDX6_9BILA
MGKENKELVNNKKELLKKEIETLQMQMDLKLNKILEEKIPTFVLEVNEIAQMIDNEEKPLESKFIQQLIDKVRPLYVDARKDHLLLLSKVRTLKLEKHIKDDEPTMEVLRALDTKVYDIYQYIGNEQTDINAYHKDRTELERDLHRSQGNEALVEYDRRFIDILRVNLELVRDFVFVFLKLAEKKMDILLTSSEKQKAKKNEHLSISQGNEALVEYDRRFIDILRVNLELVRDFVFVFLKLAEKKMDILLTSSEKQKAKKNEHLSISQGNEALVEYDRRFIDILRVNLELVRDFVFVFLKLAEKKMDILLTSSEKQKAKKNEHLSISQGNEALVEYDRRFIDILRVNLELVRDFVFVFLKLAEKKMDILLTSSEKQKAKKNEHLSISQGNEALVEYDRRFIDILRVNLELVRDFVFVFLKLAEKKMDILLTSSEKQKAKKNEHLSISQGNEALVEYDRRFIDILRVNLELVRDFVFVFLKLAEKKMDILLTSSEKQKAKKNEHLSQGNEALVEYDRRFIDILRVNLELVRDFVFVFLKLAEKKMDILLTSSEKQKAKKNEHLSISQGNEALVEYDRRFIDILRVNLELVRDFVFVFLKLAEKKMDILLTSSEKQKAKKNEHLSISQGNEALVEYDRRFIDILRVNLELVRDFVFVFLKLAEKKMDILLTSSEKQKAKKNEHLSQGNEALVEYDRRFIDILRVNLELVRDFVFVFLKLAEKKMDILLTSSEKQKAKKNEHLSISQGNEALVEYDRRFIDILRVNLELVRDFVFVFLKLAEKKMDILLTSSEKQKAKKNEHLSISQGNEALVEYDRRFIDILRVNLELVRDFVFVFLKLAEKKMDILLTSSEKQKAKKNEHLSISQGNEALVEYDRRFIDILRVNLELVRDFVFVFLKLAEKKMDILLTSSEKQKAKKNEHLSISQGNEALVEYDRRFIDILRVNLELVRDFVFVFLKLAEKKMDILLTSSEKQKAKKNEHLSISQGNEALVEYDRRFIDILRVNLELVRDFVFVFLKLAEKKMDILLTSSEKQKAKKNEHLSISQGNEALVEYDRRFIDILRVNLELVRDFVFVFLKLAEKKMDILLTSKAKATKHFVEYDRRFIDILRVNLELVRDFVFVFLKLAEKKMDILLTSSEKQKAKKNEHLSISQGNEALVEYDRRFIDILRVNLELVRDFVFVFLKLAEKKMDILLTSSEKQKPKKNEHFFRSFLWENLF